MSGRTSGGGYSIYSNADAYQNQTEYVQLTTGTLETGEAGIGIFTSRPTNTSVLYCIATKNIYIDARYDYSTTEKVVGTWVNGKPLYQKTILLGSEYIPNAEMKTVAHGISNVDEVIDIKGVFLNSSTHTSTDAPRIQDNMTNGNIPIDVDRTSLYIKGRGTDFTSAFTDIYVTIQYTKTTN